MCVSRPALWYYSARQFVVYRIVLMNGGKSEYDRIMSTYTNTTDNQERKYAMNTLGSAADPALKLATLDWAVRSGEVKLQDFFYPIGSVSCNAQGVELAWQYLQDNFQFIKDKLAKVRSVAVGRILLLIFLLLLLSAIPACVQLTNKIRSVS